MPADECLDLADWDQANWLKRILQEPVHCLKRVHFEVMDWQLEYSPMLGVMMES